MVKDEVSSRAKYILDKRKDSSGIPWQSSGEDRALHREGLGSILGQETKILQTRWRGQKEAKLVKQFSNDGYACVCSSNGHRVGVTLGGGVMD